MKTRLATKSAWALFLLTLAGLVLAGSVFAQDPADPAQPAPLDDDAQRQQQEDGDDDEEEETVVELSEDFSELIDGFNASDAPVRIVMLISPT